MTVLAGLGIDFGRVIQGGPDLTGKAADTMFPELPLAAAVLVPATAGMFSVLPRLVAAFAGQAWIISKCGPATEARTLAWLDHHNFYDRTGLSRGNVRFCRRREDKATHCRDLGVSHMIDDRLEVHAALRGIVPYRYLFGPQTDSAPDWVIPVRGWPQAGAMILPPG